MTYAELREWLNVDDTVTLPYNLVSGMAEIPVPVTAADQLTAFGHFLLLMAEGNCTCHDPSDRNK